jgi:hypothetical protein
MAEPTPELLSGGSTRPEIYRPLSKLAVGAILIAGAYAALISLFGVVAMVTGWPLFLNLWNLLFPVTGLALAYAGRQAIRHSEGVLSGLALTTWAWWLSILFGLGYGAYYFGTYMAVSWQAEDFITRWIDKIRAGKINEAFLDTQEPARRKYDNPSDSEYMYSRYGLASGPRNRGHLSVFQDMELIRLLQNAGPELQVKLLGVKNWEYDKGGYQVAETYRITTPEGDFDGTLVVKSSDSKEIEGRQWQVAAETLRLTEKPNLSPLGQTLDRWRLQSGRFVGEWLMKRGQGDALGAFLDTRPVTERTSLPRELGNRLALAALSAGLNMSTAGVEPGLLQLLALFHVDGQLRRDLYLPGYWAYATGQLVRSDGFVALKKLQTDIIRAVKGNFTDPARVVFQRVGEGRGRVLIVNADKGPVQFFLDCALSVSQEGKAAGAPPDFSCDAALIVESDVGPLTSERKPVWRIVGLQLIRGNKPTAAGPEGAAGP